MLMFAYLLLFAASLAGALPGALPVISIDRDNIEITKSCTVNISADPIIDGDNNGVIHIAADNITVDFAGAKLHGAKADQLPDSFAGIGISITGNNVTLTGASISGYKVGVRAVKTDDLTIATCDLSGNFQQHLKSTPEAEDGSDWLWPHANDQHEWMNNYGAGIYIEDSKGVTLHDITAHHGQNGIILDRVNDSKLYDCDCSFLSGWGLAMWRSNRNVISRNAFDFCVRGYSHGVYNRGQDSAGILMFEQCCQNTIAENSVTHGGDGFFGFAGKEALGEVNPRADSGWYKKRGCNNNTFISNDFSFAPAHGLELTFSFDNRIINNLFTANAICGIWGGYSQYTEIRENIITLNGDMAYGSERGGINIEHGACNRILDNQFMNNACGVHLWSDDDGQLLLTPWAKENHVGARANIVVGNTFDRDAIALQLRQATSTIFSDNTFNQVATTVKKDDASDVVEGVQRDVIVVEPTAQLFGKNHPVAKRASLYGREHIIITEWGPYDWESPYLQRIDRAANQHTYRLLGKNVKLNERAIHVEGEADASVDHDRITITPHTLGGGAAGAGSAGAITPYTMSMDINGTHLVRQGTLIDALWHIEVFPYQTDPRQNLDAWHAEAKAGAIAFTATSLDLPYGNNGPSQLQLDSKVTAANLPKDHFGTMATTKITVPAGKWRIKTISDDGIRVWLDEKLIIDDWTHHGPTPHDYQVNLDQAQVINLRVEHFELDGFAVLKLEINSN